MRLIAASEIPDWLLDGCNDGNPDGIPDGIPDGLSGGCNHGKHKTIKINSPSSPSREKSEKKSSSENATVSNDEGKH